MSDKISKIKKLDLLEGLAEEQIAAIEKSGTYLNLKKNETLFVENESAQSIYIIVYGSFKITRKEEHGDYVIFNFLDRNQTLGSSVARLPNPYYTVSAVANEESCVLKLSLNQFKLHFLKNPALESRVHTQILERFAEFQNDRCLNNSFACQKLARFLLSTLDRQPQSCRNQIMMPLTRVDIARRLGTKTETIVRHLSQWRKNGWVHTHSKHIEIINRQALEKIAFTTP